MTGTLSKGGPLSLGPCTRFFDRMFLDEESLTETDYPVISEQVYFGIYVVEALLSQTYIVNDKQVNEIFSNN